jgi:hypothetical protein
MDQTEVKKPTLYEDRVITGKIKQLSGKTALSVF